MALKFRRMAQTVTSLGFKVQTHKCHLSQQGKTVFQNSCHGSVTKPMWPPNILPHTSSLPFSLPSKCGLVATLKPGWGIRKQPIFEKQDLICLRICCNSGCCLSDTWIMKNQCNVFFKSLIRISNSDFYKNNKTV